MARQNLTFKPLRIGISLILISAVAWAGWTSLKLFMEASVTAKLGVLTGALSVIALIYNNFRQQEREIKSRHFSEKRQAYQKFFDFLFELFAAHKTGHPLSEEENFKKMQDIMKHMMVWGSADTINYYNYYMRSTVDGKLEGVELFFLVENLFRSLRSDLGHNDRKLENLALTKLLIKADEHDLLDKAKTKLI